MKKNLKKWEKEKGAALLRRTAEDQTAKKK